MPQLNLLKWATFAGWYQDEALTDAWDFAVDTAGPQDMTLYANWTPNDYTISFNSHGGSAVAPVTAAYDTTISEPAAPNRAGYYFAGWYEDEALNDAWDFAADRVPASDLTLHAKWTLIPTFNVTLLSSPEAGGTVSGGRTYEEGTTVTLDVYAAEGYQFLYWQEGDVTVTQATYSFDIHRDHTFTAVFELLPSSYTMEVSQTSTLAFPAATQGYAAVEASTVTISRSGLGDILNLTVQLGGNHAEAFAAGALEANQLTEAAPMTSFTVQPVAGLEVGTYTAMVTITGDGSGEQDVTTSFDVSFTVNALPTDVGGNDEAEDEAGEPASTITSPSSYAINASTGGQVHVKGLILSIPADALEGNVSITVEPLEASTLKTEWQPTDASIVGQVFEITKDEEGRFKKNIVITLPFDGTNIDLEQEDVFVAWLDEATNTWIMLDNVIVDEAAGTISGEVDHFTKFAVLTQPKPDTVEVVVDDIEHRFLGSSGHWAEASIAELVKRGVVNGYQDGTFRPDNAMTRAEFVTILVKALNLRQAESTGSFKDMEQHWAKSTVDTAHANGIVTGFEDGTFKPDAFISQEQMAVLIAKAWDLETAVSGKDFTDQSDISGWAAASIIAASAQGILSGFEDGSFMPQAHTTRAEAVSVILRALDS